MGKFTAFLQQKVPAKRILVISLCFFFSFGTDIFTPLVNADSTRGVSVQDRVDYLFSLNNIEVIDARNTESTYPTWAKMDPELSKSDLSYWVNDVLPFAQDRKASAYIVYPKAGIVVPVLTPNQSDADLIRAGKAFNHYPYLEKGALHYFGTSPSRGAGNLSIAAHSSYLKQDPGRYKTVFQALPITNIGDTIWYFEKNAEGKFDRYEYEVSQSFETDKYNVSILNYLNDGKSYITTYGCYPIGSNEERWVNKGILKGVTKNHSSLDAVAKPAVQPGLSLPLDIDFGVDPSPAPIQLIGLNALDAANAKKAQTLAVGAQANGVTKPSSVPNSVPNPQDIAAQIAAAQGVNKEPMLGVAPLETGLEGGDKNEEVKKVVRVRRPRPTTEVAVAEVERAPLVPTKTLSIDTKDMSKIMRHTIVQSTKITAGDVVEVPTQTNPVLSSNACYTPKSSSVIALGDNTKTRDLVAYQGLMHAYGLTSFTDTDSFLPENGLKRYEAAKILVNIAKNVLCRQPKDTFKEGMYKDIAGVDPTLVPYIKEAYEYGIMKGGKGKFRPLDRITRQEFIAGLMRIFLNTYLTESNSADWYKNYEQVFADYGLNSLLFDRNSITRFDISKVFYMIYYSDAYQSSDAGYVLPSTVE